MLITMIAIFLFSAQSSSDSYRASEKFSRVIKAEKVTSDSSQIADNNPNDAITVDTDNSGNTNYIVLGFLNTRKLAHMLAYFALGVFTYGSFSGRWKYAIVLAVDYFYACTDEIHQHFIGRTGCFTDTLYDVVGIVLAIVLCEMAYRIIRRKENKPVKAL